jgi:hypothetical protein
MKHPQSHFSIQFWSLQTVNRVFCTLSTEECLSLLRRELAKKVVMGFLITSFSKEKKKECPICDHWERQKAIHRV